MESGKVDQLLDQVTRIADALQFQQELKIKELEQNMSRPADGSCKSLIQAANTMGGALQGISASVDSANGGRLQTTQATEASVRSAADRARVSELELNEALKTLQSQRGDVVGGIVDQLAPFRT